MTGISGQCRRQPSFTEIGNIGRKKKVWEKDAEFLFILGIPNLRY